MKNRLLYFFSLSIVLFYKTECSAAGCFYFPVKDSIPSSLLGNFTDDYGIRYNITDSLWTQYPDAKYHIIKWNPEEQYIIAKNDDKNPEDKGLFTRIDYMPFKNMEPYEWGFCLTVYNAKSESIAELSGHADRQNPKKGCGGFPFSRMKRIE
ncbi:MAG: hypothetical protein WDO19_00045 [Bacteroidota bacterium]